MKKILILIIALIGLTGYGQAEFDAGIQITGGQPTVSSVNFLTTTELSGILGKIDPVLLPLSTATINAINVQDATVVHRTGNIVESVDGQKTFLENIQLADTKGIIVNGMTLKGSDTGIDQLVISSNTAGDAGRLHIEPKEHFFTGTKSKLDWMFDAYQLDFTDYRLFNIYCKDDFSMGTNGISVISAKSQGLDNFGMYPIMHFGFQDDSNNSVPMKIAYFDTSETTWRTTFKGSWRTAKPIVLGDYVTANFNLYVATSSGDCGTIKPSHSSGSQSDGTVTWSFVKAFNSANIKPTVLFGDRSDMPKFGFSTARTQQAKDDLIWYGVLSRYINASDAEIVNVGTYSTGLRTATTGGMKIEVENTAQNWILRNSSNVGVYRMMANGTISNAIDVVNKGYLDTQLALKANSSNPAFTGVPTAPTAVAGTNTTQLATTAFVASAINTDVSIQKIVDNADRDATVDGGSSGISVLNGSADDREFSVYTGNSTSSVISNLYVTNNSVALNNEDQGSSLGEFKILNGFVRISETNPGFGTTEMNFEPAITGTVISVPANSVSGAYLVQMQPKQYTVSTLPTPTGSDSRFAIVTDATSPTYLNALIGGGSVTCPVFYNGTIWVSH